MHSSSTAILRRLLLALGTLLASVSNAEILSPPFGEYRTSQGSLSIHQVIGGEPYFSIEVTGGNGHTCSVYGAMRGMKGYPYDSVEPVCIIDFVLSQQTITVTAPEACHQFCGMRAWIEGKYRRVPPGCSPKQDRARRDSFARQYRSGAYQRAYATLSSFYDECGDLLFWIDMDQIRSDLAITLYHMNRAGDCLAILDRTVAAESKGRDELRSNLPPSDFDSYVKTAEAIWHNMQLCRARK
jgi:hypothetical protein